MAPARIAIIAAALVICALIIVVIRWFDHRAVAVNETVDALGEQNNPEQLRAWRAAHFGEPSEP